MLWKICLWCFAFMLCCSCHRNQPQGGENANGAAEQQAGAGGAERRTIKLTSTAFQEGGMIPVQYTCAGANVSPPLAWGDVPAETKALALVVDDPDAPRGTWVHWVAYNLSPATKTLPENVPALEALAGGGQQGKNDFGKLGYGGPCPPDGTHRYYFKLYALNAELNLPAGATKQDLLKAMYGHILDEGQLLGRFKR
ncbi:MAG: YbhB/YbcL family Raf kinase inhibitor-like protein [Pyrinomonadaceae bacterium]